MSLSGWLGLVGLGSRYVQDGDLVCILFGCSVPVSLREIRDRKCFELVGECYVHREIDSEVLAAMDEQSINSEIVEFNVR